jgi:protoporphyrinogen oxidase
MPDASRRKRAIIIGAGPAGLTAAYELLTRSDVDVVVLEATDMVGGISQTVAHRGNRMDIGGHRFFSKSDRVMNWWLDMLPLERLDGRPRAISYQGRQRDLEEPTESVDPRETDDVMLLRERRSRIYYMRRFFDYPLSLSVGTVRNLGLMRTIRIGLSYLKARLLPLRPEENLEQFFVNRFGRQLYETFFESYTEKVWGVSCKEISAEWGAQRIKGLSILKAVLHPLKALVRRDGDISQKSTETSLINQFLYPKYGPGQMWEVCARKVTSLGGQIFMNMRADEVLTANGQVTGVNARDVQTGDRMLLEGEYVFSSMPVSDLIAGIADAPANVRDVSERLVYRDFLTVGLLVEDLEVHEETTDGRTHIRDNWIYIQDEDVRLGRLQVFNNWSPYMVADPTTVWIGLEYFCDEGDDLWEKPDSEMADFGARELERIGLIDRSRVLDSVVIRMPKTYPAYFGSYERFGEIRDYTDTIEGLYLVGRNGMHRYNNQDHSMLTAMTAVDNIIAGRVDKDNVWSVNTEQDYHEERDGGEPGDR